MRVSGRNRRRIGSNRIAIRSNRLIIGAQLLLVTPPHTTTRQCAQQVCTKGHKRPSQLHAHVATLLDDLLADLDRARVRLEGLP